MEYCKCGGKGGYLLKDGELICQTCGGLSPKTRLAGNQFIKIGEGRIVCPKCGHVIQEARITEQPERIVPKGVNKVGRPSKRR